MPKPDDVGVGTAMLVLNRTNQLLLGLRKGAHRAGHWSFPGGWLDRADTETVQAAIRETLEETGLTVHVAKPFCWVTEDHPSIETRTVTLYHVTDYYGWVGEPKVMEPNKCERWEWFDLDNLPSPLFPGLADAIEQYKKREAEVSLLREAEDALRASTGAYEALDAVAQDFPEVGRLLPGLHRERNKLKAFLSKLSKYLGPLL